GRPARTIACRDPPAPFAVTGEATRIAPGVLLLDVRGSTAILEVVEAAGAQKTILDASKVDPEVGHPVIEQRPGVKVLVTVEPPKGVAGCPGGIALGREGVGRRTHP